jgi:hypothetical protein
MFIIIVIINLFLIVQSNSVSNFGIIEHDIIEHFLNATDSINNRMIIDSHRYCIISIVELACIGIMMALVIAEMIMRRIDQIKNILGIKPQPRNTTPPTLPQQI